MTEGWVATTAWAAAAGFLAIAVFQVALALGAPLGRAAWGGTQTQLPTPLRVASAVAIVVWVVAALVVLARAGIDASPIPEPAARWATWIVVGLVGVGAFVNFASRSRWERFLWGPMSTILTVLSVVVATSD